MSPQDTDVLSDVLRAVHLTGAVYFNFDLTSPWVAEALPSRDIASIVMPGSQRVIEYHVIARGAAWGGVVGQPPLRLREGDLIIFPQGGAHVLSSTPGMRADTQPEMYERRATLPMVYEGGGGGPERARIVCGFLGCDERPFNPLLAALPRVIHLGAHGAQSSSGWLSTILQIAMGESEQKSPGSENVLARLSELLFVEAIRRYLAMTPALDRGWLAGLRDPAVGRALAALHAAPHDDWTVDRLARIVAISRSVLADRFVQLVGHPPMQYLALWRMQLAARHLGDGCTVGEVAQLVGYDSEAAFSRAFKKLVGDAPSAWRRRSSPPATN